MEMNPTDVVLFLFVAAFQQLMANEYDKLVVYSPDLLFDKLADAHNKYSDTIVYYYYYDKLNN